MGHTSHTRLERLCALGGLTLTELASLSGRSHAAFTNARSRGSEITLPTLRAVASLAPTEPEQRAWLSWLSCVSAEEPSAEGVVSAVNAARTRRDATKKRARKAVAA